MSISDALSSETLAKKLRNLDLRPWFSYQYISFYLGGEGVHLFYPWLDQMTDDVVLKSGTRNRICQFYLDNIVYDTQIHVI